MIVKILNLLYILTIINIIVNLVIILEISLKLVSSNSTSGKSNTTVTVISTKPESFFYKYHKEHINYNLSDYWVLQRRYSVIGSQGNQQTSINSSAKSTITPTLRLITTTVSNSIKDGCFLYSKIG